LRGEEDDFIENYVVGLYDDSLFGIWYWHGDWCGAVGSVGLVISVPMISIV
jgi:hypothetical protein